MPRYEVKAVTAYTVVDTETGLDYRTYDSNEAASAVTEALNDLEAKEAKAVIDATEDTVAEPNGSDTYYGI